MKKITFLDIKRFMCVVDQSKDPISGTQNLNAAAFCEALCFPGNSSSADTNLRFPLTLQRRTHKRPQRGFYLSVYKNLPIVALFQGKKENKIDNIS